MNVVADVVSWAYRGEAWHRLRREDFSQVELDASPELWDLLKSMMRAAPALRIGIMLEIGRAHV